MERDAIRRGVLVRHHGGSVTLGGPADIAKAIMHQATIIEYNVKRSCLSLEARELALQMLDQKVLQALAALDITR